MANENSLSAKLNRPYYLETVISKRWLSCLQYGVFVFLFLLAFQPFGLSSLPEGIVSAALGYGLTTFLVMALLNIPFFPLLPAFFAEEKWTVQKELYWNLLNVMAIGLANTLFSAYIGMVTFSSYTLLIFELYTITLAIIPITVTVLLKESRLKNKFEKRSQEINIAIEEHKEEELILQEESSLLIILSENEKDKVEVRLSDLLFIQSSDNYLEVHYLNKGLLQKKLLRNTLKGVASSLENHKELFRCHKSYLVNIFKIDRVSGNAQGYKLHLKGTEILVPVSRQNNEEIKKRLSA